MLAPDPKALSVHYPTPAAGTQNLYITPWLVWLEVREYSQTHSRHNMQAHIKWFKKKNHLIKPQDRVQYSTRHGHTRIPGDQLSTFDEPLLSLHHFIFPCWFLPNPATSLPSATTLEVTHAVRVARKNTKPCFP